MSSHDFGNRIVMAFPDIFAVLGFIIAYIRDIPPHSLLLSFVILSGLAFGALYLLIFFAAPHPREPLPSEKKYCTILPDGQTSGPLELPCWSDTWAQSRRLIGDAIIGDAIIEPPEVFMSVVVPAYNEEQRLPGMLEEAVTFLEQEYGTSTSSPQDNEALRQRLNTEKSTPSGWEILIVSDGSTDATITTALDFARTHTTLSKPTATPGPRTPHPASSTQISSGSIRVVELARNRGKGGAVTHGLRHVRGQYAIFADADGASKFPDLAKMLRKAQQLETQDADGRAVVIGSRAHLVGSEAVVKRSKLRNILMYTFHLFIRLLTTSQTSRIGDTQCGFKLFSRAALPCIVPYMHTEGWIFDVEMLMLAEAASIPMEEVPVGWKEVMGSKLNVVWDSLGMAWGLAVVRGAWGLGIWRRS